MAKMLFTLACEQEDLFAALLKLPGVKLSVGVPDTVERKPYTKRLQNGSAPPLLLAAPDAKGKKPPKGNSAGGFILRHMAQEPAIKHTMIAINKAGEAEGYSGGNISVAMSKLIKDGLTERIGIGLYKLTKQGLKVAAPTEAQPHKIKRQRKAAGTGKTNREVIWKLFKPGQPVTMAEITAAFKNDDRNPNSASPQIAKLKNEGLVEQVSQGTYQITQKGMTNHVATATA